MDIRDLDTIYEIMRVYQLMDKDFEAFNREQEENFSVTISKKQWDEKIREKLIKANRPAFSYNLIRVIINTLIGVERDNRKSIAVSPRGIDDYEKSDLMTKVLKYFMYHSGFERARNRVFYDKIIGRIGVYHIGWEYEDEEDDYGKLFVKRIDPREIRWDLNAKDNLWSDAKYVIRRHFMDIDDMIITYALKNEELKEAILIEAKSFYNDVDRGKWISRKLKNLFETVYSTITNSTLSNIDKSRWYDSATNRFEVIEMHENRVKNLFMIRDLYGNLIDITDEYFKKWKECKPGRMYDGYTLDRDIVNLIKEENNLEGELRRDLVKKKYVTAVCPAFGLKLNEQEYPIDTKYFVYIPDYCYDTHLRLIEAQSVIDDVKDVQYEFNKGRSLLIELIGRAANKGYIAEAEAIKGHESDWTDNAIGRIKMVNPGYLNSIKPEEGINIPTELIRLSYDTQQLIKVITNAEDELRGVKSPGVTSGRHFLAKEQRQAKSFTIILENRDNALKALHEVALNFIQKYVSTQRTIRITKEIYGAIESPETLVLNQRAFDAEGERIKARIINDITALDYDVEITEEQYTVSAQEERYMKLSEIFNAVIRLNPRKAELLLPTIIKNIGIKDSDEIIKIWQQADMQNAMPNEAQRMSEQLAMIMAKLGIEEKKAEVDSLKLDNVKKEIEIRQAYNSGYEQALNEALAQQQIRGYH